MVNKERETLYKVIVGIVMLGIIIGLVSIILYVNKKSNEKTKKEEDERKRIAAELNALTA